MSSEDQLMSDQRLQQENAKLLRTLKNQDCQIDSLCSSSQGKQQSVMHEYNRKLSDVSDSISKLEKEIEQYKRYIPAVQKEIEAYLIHQKEEMVNRLQREYNEILSNLSSAKNRKRELYIHRFNIGDALYDSLFKTGKNENTRASRVLSIIGVALCCCIFLIMVVFAIIHNIQDGDFFSDLMADYKIFLTILCFGAMVFVVLSFIMRFVALNKSIKNLNRSENTKQVDFEEQRNNAIKKYNDELDRWKKKYSQWITNDEFDRSKVNSFNCYFTRESINEAIHESESKVRRRMEFSPSVAFYKFEINPDNVLK